MEEVTAPKKRDWKVFVSSIFFVLGFSVIFSILGVLLQSVLVSVAGPVQTWLSRIGGAIIIIFGLFLMGLLKISFLERDHRFSVKKKFKSMHLTSFMFGAAFAVGWTPCVGAILGAILTLAATNPGSAFFLMLSYSLGLGIPFLLVGLFANEARQYLLKPRPWLIILERVFGVLLVVLGIMIFTNNLSLLSNFSHASTFLTNLDLAVGGMGSTVNIGIAFLAGIVSFLSPCVLPLVPGYLTFLAASAVSRNE